MGKEIRRRGREKKIRGGEREGESNGKGEWEGEQSQRDRKWEGKKKGIVYPLLYYKYVFL